MKTLILAFVTITLPAAAQTVPSVILLPTPVVTAIRQYLGQRPHDEVAALIDAMEACVAVQLPPGSGAPAAHGDCPAVTEALQAREKGSKSEQLPPAAR